MQVEERGRAPGGAAGDDHAPITPGCARPINAGRSRAVALELLLHLRATFHECRYWLVSAPSLCCAGRMGK